MGESSHWVRLFVKNKSKWKLIVSRILATVGVLIVVAILAIFGFFVYEARQIDKMTERFRTELDNEPNAFRFVERNAGFFSFALRESTPPFKECLSVSPIRHKHGEFSIHIGEAYENGSLEHALTTLKAIRARQDCSDFSALYFRTPSGGGFRRVSVRMKIDDAGLLTSQPEFHIYD